MAAEMEANEDKTLAAIARKQRPTGIWASNLLGLAASAPLGIKDVGTVPQVRRMRELGWSADDRTAKLATRLLFRVISRDPDPTLLGEYRKLVKSAPAMEPWVRGHLREAAAAALAELGMDEDPRLRGAAHKTASTISQFLRSDLAAKPLSKSGQSMVLDPEAWPPSWYSVAMFAAMPALQRDRAGFVDRLGSYLAQPKPKKPFSVKFGRKGLKPTHLLLGNPIEADAKGVAKDIPLALHFMEMLARIGIFDSSPNGAKVLKRLLKDCDDDGVWSPKGLRSAPRAADPITYHYYPLAPSDRSMESRKADVTFRLSLIAKQLGWELEYV